MNYVNYARGGVKSAGSAVTKPFTGGGDKPGAAEGGDKDKQAGQQAQGSDGEEFLVPEFSEDQLRSKEGTLSYLLRSARNKYVDRDLVCKVTIQMLYGVVLSGEFCTVGQHDKAEDLSDVDSSQLSSLNFKALSSVDAILANLS
jgi:hypothetical protein